MSEIKPKKMVRRSVLVALGIICILLTTGLGGAMTYYTMTINDKDTTFESYALGHSHTNDEYNNATSYADAEYNNLTTYVSDHHYTDELSNSLNSAYQDYVFNHRYTSDEYGSLLSQYASLEANYSQLMQDYQAALAKIPPDKGITIDAVNWTAGQGVTGVAVRNLGVNATTVVSLKLYWTNEGVLASSASVNVVISGNSTASIQAFLPINGWNTEYDTWVLKVETLEGYSATSDPLMLIL